MRVSLALLLTMFFTHVGALTYIEPPAIVVERKACDISVEECVKWFAKEYGVSHEIMDYIVRNESSYNEKAIGDMDITCPRNGEPVRSRGIIQISTCWYPEVPDDCAFNAECSLATMIKLIKDEKTCKSQWTTCRHYYAVR